MQSTQEPYTAYSSFLKLALTSAQGVAMQVVAWVDAKRLLACQSQKSTALVLLYFGLSVGVRSTQGSFKF